MAQIERSIYFLKVVLNYSFIFLVVVHGLGLEKAQTFERLVLKLGKEGTYLDSVEVLHYGKVPFHSYDDIPFLFWYRR